MTEILSGGELMKKRRNILFTVLFLIVLTVVLVLIGRGQDTRRESSNTPVYSFEDPDWWNHAVFYEIFVRSFYDSNGDGIGDFNGITEKLDYLNDGDPNTTNDLGINAIWLMPIFPSPSYHGYDVTDYYDVNPDYGTREDFEKLLAEAHKRGIHVIIDFVINHTSNQHPWFVSALDPTSQYHNYYIWSQTNPGYKGPWGEDVWHKAANGLYYYGVFTANMPDLNYENQPTTDEIEKVAKFWIEEIGVDGFRIDGARHLIEEGEKQANTEKTIAWFTDFRKLFKSWNPSAMAVGEVWDSSYNTIHYLKSDSLDMVFDFDLANAIISGVRMGSSSNLSANIITETKLYGGSGMGTFLTNHDMNRVMSQLNDDPKLAGHAATILLTIPGTPFIYYGEEIGMTGEKPDEQIRTPMQWTGERNGGFTSGSPWEYLKVNYKTTNVESQTNDPSSLLSLYRELIHLRVRHTALLDGEYIMVRSSNPALYAAIRQSQGEIILTVVNLSGEEITTPTFKISGGTLDGEYTLTKLIGQGEFAAELTVTKKSNVSSFTFSSNIPADGNLVFLLAKK